MENYCILWLIILVSLGSAMTLACGKCDPDAPCPPLPAKNCDVVQRPCHCCKECARRVGDHCSWATARCASGLMCVNDDGEALVKVPRFLTYFKGTCQFVVIQPIVVENTDVMERRQRIQKTLSSSNIVHDEIQSTIKYSPLSKVFVRSYKDIKNTIAK